MIANTQVPLHRSRESQVLLVLHQMSAPMPRLGGASSAAMGRKIRSRTFCQSSKKRCQREGAGWFGGRSDGGEDIDRIIVTRPFYRSSVASFFTSCGENSVRVS